jgi:hypothetical protein
LANFQDRGLTSSEKKKKKSLLLKRRNNMNDMSQQPQEPILPPPFVPQTIAEFIFADEDGNMPELLDL